ncbi:aldo/keto reductase [Aquisalimonas sp.]|uniref:aldo/keto reductase n=1 Tax=Aquisalimonas sp. TaxID=1872621 RepID=UPI0025C1FF2F|nr:aldo/keto reductase [Aquisalimonas sp.]
MNRFVPGRRRFLRHMTGALGAGAFWAARPGLVAGGAALTAPVTTASDALHVKAIPGSGEHIPAIGMGTYVTFNVGANQAMRDQLTEVLRTFFDMGGGMIDSSPMYGTAEEVLGDCLDRLDDTDDKFSATKIWTRRTADGETQIDDSLALWGISRFDLMQVHNLVNWQAHLETIRDRKQAGEIRYAGVTTSHGRRHGELEQILRNEPVDFVQLTYNVLDREVEGRLLPLARERGIAVIANRPFRRGNLFDRVNGAPLPDWAGDYAIDNWAQFFLKFIISHEAVTCAIPATSRVEHMHENMGAMRGPLPDANARREMIAYLERL